MNDTIQQFLDAGPLQAVAAVLFLLVLFVAFALIPLCLVIYLVYSLLTLPMRRNERARMFLDLLELGLKEGGPPERVIASAADTADLSLGLGFFEFASELQQGQRLEQALDAAPRLLTPQIRAMLKTGARIGDLAKVLPACRQLLRDGVSQVRGGLNYLLVLMFVVMPIIFLIFRIQVVPRFIAVFQGMFEGATWPAFTRFVFDQSGFLLLIHIGVIGVLSVVLIGYVGGPRLHGWLNFISYGAPDWLLSRLPWRRKRLQRDFSAMLAVLLDAEVPEAEAVTMAADATANVTMQRRAEKVSAQLKAGIKLPEALRAMDDSAELHWRLANAVRRGSGFLRALAGWHEALDARAFQLEQSAAQIATTALVLLNGVIVACVMIAVFLAITDLINRVALW
jgi:type II secretory pathway component PulF